MLNTLRTLSLLKAQVQQPGGLCCSHLDTVSSCSYFPDSCSSPRTHAHTHARIPLLIVTPHCCLVSHLGKGKAHLWITLLGIADNSWRFWRLVRADLCHLPLPWADSDAGGVMASGLSRKWLLSVPEEFRNALHAATQRAL